MALTKARVLLADDDPALRRLIGTTLGTEDFDLLHAADGEEALRMAREQHPRLVLLDINMPKLDGFEVCRQLKANPETVGIKVVLLTARGTEIDQARGREVGADEYFVKPFSPVQLLNKVYALLE
ncbi:MAG TPA: response regulator [Chloroflexota bacterium]|nr:response regulator [Chloroflexota bacterium]